MAKSGVLYESNQPQETPKETTKLSSLANIENEPLFTFKGVFPFDFFPNVITIYRNKISIVKKEMFILSRATNIPIENINYVTAHLYFPFAALEISDRYFSEEPFVINNLRRGDASKAMKIIDGLRLANAQKIDVTKVPKQELLQDIEKIGVVEPEGQA